MGNLRFCSTETYHECLESPSSVLRPGGAADSAFLETGSFHEALVDVASADPRGHN